MATGKSGYFDVSNGGFTLRINWSETYDIVSNTSVVSITSADLMSTTYSGYSYFPHHYIKVNGQEVATFNSSLGTHSYYISAKNTFYGINAASGSPPPWTSSAIAHNTDGTKSITIEVYINLWRTSSGAGNGTNLSGSQTIALTTIPRKSSLSVESGTLGTAQTLTVSKQASNFTHTITAKCGSASTTVCTKSSSTSISFTPPIGWASQNTTGTSVSVTYTITTYNGDTSVGSNSYTVNCTIPASVKPSVSISVSDAMEYASTYGGYIKGLSKFKIDLTETPSYGSAIASRTITANGSTYTSEPVTTDIIKSSGTLTISASVKDKRGRTGSASTTATVLDYSAPIISLLKVNRCNSDGTENAQGDHVKVTYSGSVTSLSNKNGCNYIINYKKTTESTYTSNPIDSLNGVYSVTSGTYIFSADSGSSYNIVLTINDHFTSTSKSVVASTAFTMMHFNAAGNGMAIGKISETENLFEVGLDSSFKKDLYTTNPVITSSDRNIKDNINELTEKHMRFFMQLQPVSFTFTNGSSGRTHIGFISQDVEIAMLTCGLTDLDFAGFCKYQKTEQVAKKVKVMRLENKEVIVEEQVIYETVPIEGEYIYALRYEEFIALNTYVIQHLYTEIETIKRAIGL